MPTEPGVAASPSRIRLKTFSQHLFRAEGTHGHAAKIEFQTPKNCHRLGPAGSGPIQEPKNKAMSALSVGLLSTDGQDEHGMSLRITRFLIVLNRE